MSHEEYRDDLAAAHRRIAQLEDLRRGQGGLPPRRHPRKARRVAIVVGLVWIGMFAALYISLGAWVFAPSPSSSYVPSPAAAPTPQPRLYAGWYTQADLLPTFVDVDGDGTKDIVGLFWRAGDEAKPLYAAAIDGATFALKWSAGPYPSQWASTRTHLTVVKDKVIVTDSQEDFIVLGLKDGIEVRRTKIRGGITQLCAPNDGTSRAFVHIGAFSTTESSDRLIDLVDGSMTGATRARGFPAMSCAAARYEACQSVRDGRPCYTWGAVASAPQQLRDTRAGNYQRTLHEADRAIVIQSRYDSPATGREKPYAYAFVKGEKTFLWQKSLVFAGDELHFGAVGTELRDGKLAVFYQTNAGPFRVAVYDALRGDLLWTDLVKGTQEGSYAAAFGLEEDRVIMIINQTIHLYDAITGAYLKGLDASSI